MPKFPLELRLSRLRLGALLDPSTSLSLTLVSNCGPYLAYVSSSLQYPLCVICWMIHHSLQSHHDTLLGHHVARWAPLKGRHFACRKARVTTYSIHSIFVTQCAYIKRTTDASSPLKAFELLLLVF